MDDFNTQEIIGCNLNIKEFIAILDEFLHKEFLNCKFRFEIVLGIRKCSLHKMISIICPEILKNPHTSLGLRLNVEALQVDLAGEESIEGYLGYIARLLGDSMSIEPLNPVKLSISGPLCR